MTKERKITTRMCSKCKTAFPTGTGHDARTCGKRTTDKATLRTHQSSLPAQVSAKRTPPQPRQKLSQTPSRVMAQKVPEKLFSSMSTLRGEVRVEIKTGTHKKKHLPPNWLLLYNCISKDGEELWFNEKGKLHRENNAAVVRKDGTKAWWINGKRHREGAPAVEFPNGNEEWWVNGKRHRDDGPAVEHANGDKEWWVNGKRHRVDGPATIDSEGNRAWYLNGLIHRTDGPAVEHSSGTKLWYIYGERHRDDGPAVENLDGYQAWYKHGKPHRLDGPAKEWADDGDKEWWVNGKRHRLDGPAVISPRAGPEWGIRWWVNDMDMVKHADHPDIPDIMGEHFYLLCTNENRNIRTKALANPNCPPAYKIAGKLKTN